MKTIPPKLALDLYQALETAKTATNKLALQKDIGEDEHYGYVHDLFHALSLLTGAIDSLRET